MTTLYAGWLLIRVSCMTAVAGTRFTNPEIAMAKSSLHSLLKVNYC